MPQLDTSTWFTIMLSSSIALFMLMQSKINSQDFFTNPTSKSINVSMTKMPWELKWTTIYSLHSLPQH